MTAVENLARPLSDRGPGPFSFFRINQLRNAFAPALGDPDGDRLENVVEYALVLPPTAPNVIPIPSACSYAEGERLRLLVAPSPPPRANGVPSVARGLASISPLRLPLSQSACYTQAGEAS